MTLTLQDSIDRFQANEGLLDEFINDPAQAGEYVTREGRKVPTVPRLVAEVRQAASALGAADGAGNVGYTPAVGEPTTVEQTLRELEARPDAADAVGEHEQALDPHAQYAKAQDLAQHQLASDPHPQYATKTGSETLTNKKISGPRASMAQYIDKTISNATATGTVTLDLSAADVFDLTLAGNTTLALSNAPALSGETFTIVVRVRQGATAFSLAWFAGITWLATSTPATPAANKIVEYVLSTTNGTAWLGRKGAAN